METFRQDARSGRLSLPRHRRPGWASSSAQLRYDVFSHLLTSPRLPGDALSFPQPPFTSVASRPAVLPVALPTSQTRQGRDAAGPVPLPGSRWIPAPRRSVCSYVTQNELANPCHHLWGLALAPSRPSRDTTRIRATLSRQTCPLRRAIPPRATETGRRAGQNTPRGQGSRERKQLVTKRQAGTIKTKDGSNI